MKKGGTNEGQVTEFMLVNKSNSILLCTVDVHDLSHQTGAGVGGQSSLRGGGMNSQANQCKCHRRSS